MKHKDGKDRGSARNAEEDNDPKMEKMIATAIEKYISSRNDSSGLGLTATSRPVPGKASRGSTRWRKVCRNSPIWDSGADKNYFPEKDLENSKNTERVRESVVTAAGSSHKITKKGDIGDHKEIRFVGDGFTSRLLSVSAFTEKQGPLLFTDSYVYQLKDIPKKYVKRVVGKHVDGLYRDITLEGSAKSVRKLTGPVGQANVSLRPPTNYFL